MWGISTCTIDGVGSATGRAASATSQCEEACVIVEVIVAFDGTISASDSMSLSIGGLMAAGAGSTTFAAADDDAAAGGGSSQ